MRSDSFGLLARNSCLKGAAGVTLASFLMMGAASHALAQVSSREGIALQNQILDLQQRVSQLQAAAAAGGGRSSDGSGAAAVGADGGLVAQLVQRVSTLEQQVRDMQGRLDQLGNRFDQQSASLNKQIKDMQFAAQQGGAAAAATSTSVGESSAAPAPSSDDNTAAYDSRNEAASGASLTPEALIRVGRKALAGGDYQGAQDYARKALAKANGGAVRFSAQFLLAQSLAGQKDYRQSAVAYYDAYNFSPKAPRAASALLGVSASLLAMGDKSSSCEALDKLKAEFPSASASVNRAAASLRKRSGC